MKTRLTTALFCLMACAASPDAGGGSRAAAGVTDMAWLAGHWVDESEGNLSEETWGPPSGDCLVGMWRLVIGGKAKVFELLTITTEPDGLVLRLRHFDRSGVAWEDKEHPLALKLVRSKEREAVFQGKGTEGFLRISYRRMDDALTSIVEKGASEKEAKREEFRFVRKRL